MKYYYISDIHLEFKLRTIKEIIPDIGSQEWVAERNNLIIAGDVTPDVHRFLLFLLDCSSKFNQVFVVLGNHDYLVTGLGLNDARYRLKKSITENNVDNVHVLDNQIFHTDDGLSIFGGTMWTSYNKGNPKDIAAAEMYMPELKRLFYKDIIHEHDVFIGHYQDWLQTLRKTDRISVCVTHHLPVDECVDDQYASSSLNAAFSADLQQNINGVDIWVHGHTHSKIREKLTVKMVANSKTTNW